MARRFSLRVTAALLYVSSLALPAMVMVEAPLFPHDGSRVRILWGIHCVLYGWLSPPAWFANLALAVAAIGLRFQRRALAVWSAGLAIALALTAFVYVGRDLSPHVGYLVWLASMIVALVAGLRSTAQLRERAVEPGAARE